jgi:hypothetical protein
MFHYNVRKSHIFATYGGPEKSGPNCIIVLAEDGTSPTGQGPADDLVQLGRLVDYTLPLANGHIPVEHLVRHVCLSHSWPLFSFKSYLGIKVCTAIFDFFVNVWNDIIFFKRF